MGAYLSTPVTDKETFEGEDGSFKYAISTMQGWRTSMEDAHAAVLDVDTSGKKDDSTGYFAIFDGHGGKEVAIFAAKYMADELVKSDAWKQGNLEAALADTYLKIDEILSREDTRAELMEMAGINKEQSKGDAMVLEEEQLPGYMRDVLIARIKAHNERRTLGGDDEDDGGDEFEDPDFDPLVELDQDGAEKRPVGDTDVMTRDDSDNEDSGEATSESGQDEESSAQEGSDDGEAMANGDAPVSPQQEYRGPLAGCTAVVALVRGKTLMVANAGDSRCVCSRNGKAVAMTNDHKPTDTEEHARITRAGGFISDGRVNGSLNLSRALGDLEYKRVKTLPPAQQMITAMPEIRSLQLQAGDEFLILACDGIWDVLTNQQAVEFVRERLTAGMEPRAVCEAMCDHCLAPDTGGCGKGCDNMSAMVVVLKPFAADQIVDSAPPVPPQPSTA